MKGKSGSKSKDSKPQDPVQNIADKTMRNYDQTVKTGMKFQEEAMQWWMNTMNQAASATDWQKRFTGFFTMTGDILPAAQKRMLEIMELMDKNSRTGAQLINKAVEAVQSPVISDSQNKWMELWASSLGAIRSNLEAVTQINNRVIDSWINFARKNTETTEIRVPKTA